MPTTDSGIVDANNCILLDPGPNPFWLSGAVIMEGGDPSTANPGSDTTDVTVNWKANCTLSGDIPDVLLELYVGSPSLAMTPLNTTELTASGSPLVPGPVVVAGLAEGGSQLVKVPWTPSTDPNQPDGPGHKCLIARVYPVGSTPDATALSKYIPDDQHYAQHNLSIIGPPVKEPKQRTPVSTGNGAAQAGMFTIQAVADLNPSESLLGAIMPSLNSFPGFVKVSNTPLKSIGFDMTVFGGARKCIGDFFREIGQLFDDCEDFIEKVFTGEVEVEDQKVQAHVRIQPNFFAKFQFIVDVTGATPGDAHIYHLTQIDPSGNRDGVLTVVVVAR